MQRPRGSGCARRWTHACQLLLLLIVPPAVSSELPAATRDDWVEVRSARFVVCSNAGEPAAARAARHLERLADVIESTSRGLHVDVGHEIRVYVFRNLESFTPYAGPPHDATTTTAGFHVMAPDIELIAYHRPEWGDAMTFASHEFLHAVIARSLGPIPIWANEGLAEYYSTFITRGRTADIGEPIGDHLVWLRAKGLLPLAYLFAITPSSPQYHAGPWRGIIYSESWALVHMLIRNDQAPATRFSRMLGALGLGMPTEAALRDAYGPLAVDSLEKALEAYTTRGMMAYSTFTFSNEFTEVPIRTRPMEEAEVLTQLGELALRSDPELAPLASQHFQAAWRADSSRGLPAGLECERAARENDDAGMNRWAGAVERIPIPDPRATGLAGAALASRQLRRVYAPRWPAQGADEWALRARRLLERTIEVRPGRPEWLIPYGITFLDDTTGLPLAVEALITARDEAPRRDDATAALAILQARAGAKANALTLYRSLATTGGPDAAWRHWAGYCIARRTLDDAVARFHAGRQAEAESLVARLSTDLHEAGVAEHGQRMLSWLRDPRRDAQAPQLDDRIQGPGAVDSLEAAADTISASAGMRAERSREFRKGGVERQFITAAVTAAQLGDFHTADVLLEAAHHGIAHGSLPWLDSLQAEVRNLRRLKSAKALLEVADVPPACSLYAEVLGDMPRKDVRAFVDRQRQRFCGTDVVSPAADPSGRDEQGRR